MMLRLLTVRGEDTSANGEAWCRLVMEMHRRLTGEAIWAAPEVEERREYQYTERDRSPGLTTSRIVRVQARCPATGQASITRAEIEGWPNSLLELGNVGDPITITPKPRKAVRDPEVFGIDPKGRPLDIFGRPVEA
jgi:hypothetical protein